MKANKLRSELEDADDDDEIVLVSQPNRHPLIYKVRDIIQGDDGRWYIIEGSQEGYAGQDITNYL